MIDSETGWVLRAMLYLDSLSAFRLRCTCQILEKLLAANRGLNIWHDLVKGGSHQSGSHTREGGIWLHALVPAELLSLYARLSSTADLANTLVFKDMTVVEGLLQASCMIQHMVSMEHFATGHMGVGQHFIGSWMFEAEAVSAFLCGEKPGPVQSSIVRFQCPEFISGNFNFGVRLTLCHAPGSSFVLWWQPHWYEDAQEEDLDLVDIHLHGHVAKPFILPFGYESSTSTWSNRSLNIAGGQTLSKVDVLDLLDHDCLICALTIRLYCMGDPARVTAMPLNFRAQHGWTESGHKESPESSLSDSSTRYDSSSLSDSSDSEPSIATDEKDSLADLSEKGTCPPYCFLHGDHLQYYCSICWKVWHAKLHVNNVRPIQ